MAADPDRIADLVGLGSRVRPQLPRGGIAGSAGPRATGRIRPPRRTRTEDPAGLADPVMRMASVTLERYGNYEDCRLDFGPGLTMVTWPNEAGKSALLDALSDPLGGSRDPPDTRISQLPRV